MMGGGELFFSRGVRVPDLWICRRARFPNPRSYGEPSSGLILFFLKKEEEDYCGGRGEDREVLQQQWKAHI